jgi:hypothetical protein
MRRKGNRDQMSLCDRFVDPRMQQEGPIWRLRHIDDNPLGVAPIGRGAAVTWKAIRRGQERLSVELLETIRIDEASEAARHQLHAAFTAATLTTRTRRAVAVAVAG